MTLRRRFAGLGLSVWAASALAWMPPVAAETGKQLILGTIPAYPGASRPLPRWETSRLAIALTEDAPKAVLAYYLSGLGRLGWRVEPQDLGEAHAAAEAAEPVFLTFRKDGQGRLDLQITRGRHPRTGRDVTLIFYEPQLKL